MKKLDQNYIQSLIKLLNTGQLIKLENSGKELLKQYPNEIFLYNIVATSLAKQKKLDDELYLIDGQHRYEAIKQLYHKGYTNFYIWVEEVIVNNMEEMKENYKMINYNTPLPEFPQTIDKYKPAEQRLLCPNQYKCLGNNNFKII